MGTHFNMGGRLVRRVGYPWQETVTCRAENGSGCGRLYVADYQQDRDWSFCPDCTRETGKPCQRVFDVDKREWVYRENEGKLSETQPPHSV